MAPSRLATTVFVLYCIFLHTVYGLLCLSFTDEVIGSTVLAGPLVLFQDTTVVGLLFLCVAICATISMWLPFPSNIIFLLPQQVMLFLSGSSGLAAVVLGQFATGRHADRALIAAEQIYTLFLALFHAACIVVRGTLSAYEADHPGNGSTRPRFNDSTTTQVVVTTTTMALKGPTGPTGSAGSK